MMTSPPSRRKRDPLTPRRIQDAAFERIAREGVAAFSLRGLAADLRVEPMSLYHWYPSKAHLLDALMERWVEPLEVPGPEAGDWRVRVRGAAASFRAAALARPAFFPYVAVHRFNLRATLDRLDAVIAAFAASGASAGDVARMFRAWSQLLVGVLLDETNGYARGPSAVDPPPDEEVTARWPHVASLGAFNAPSAHEAAFWFAHDTLVDAFAARLVVSGSAAGPASVVSAARRPGRPG